MASCDITGAALLPARLRPYLESYPRSLQGLAEGIAEGRGQDVRIEGRSPKQSPASSHRDSPNWTLVIRLFADPYLQLTPFDPIPKRSPT